MSHSGQLQGTVNSSSSDFVGSNPTIPKPSLTSFLLKKPVRDMMTVSILQAVPKFRAVSEPAVPQFIFSKKRRCFGRTFSQQPQDELEGITERLQRISLSSIAEASRDQIQVLQRRMPNADFFVIQKKAK